MENIVTGQLEIIARELSEIIEQQNQLKERESTLRGVAFQLLKEAKQSPIKTIYGKFTWISGSTKKTYTGKAYDDAKLALELEKTKCEHLGLFTTKRGEDTIRFDPS